MQPVTVTVVSDELEAEMVCGLLRTNGIACWHAKTNMAAAIGGEAGNLSMAGARMILVSDADLASARELLSQ